MTLTVLFLLIDVSSGYYLSLGSYRIDPSLKISSVSS